MNINKLVLSNHGGTNEGTWIHPSLAVKLVEWVCPEFNSVAAGWTSGIIQGSLDAVLPPIRENHDRLNNTTSTITISSQDKRIRTEEDSDKNKRLKEDVVTRKDFEDAFAKIDRNIQQILTAVQGNMGESSLVQVRNEISAFESTVREDVDNIREDLTHLREEMVSQGQFNELGDALALRLQDELEEFKQQLRTQLPITTQRNMDMQQEMKKFLSSSSFVFHPDYYVPMKILRPL